MLSVRRGRPDHHLKGSPHFPTPLAIKKLIEGAEKNAQEHGFRAHVFQTSEVSSKYVVQIIKAAIKKKWEHTEISKECAKQKLTQEEKAFVLNFLVYWKELEAQPEFRETAKQMVDYLFKESAEHFWGTGKASYCVSLLAEDGSPAGMLLGALLRPYELLTNNKVKMNPMRGSDFINFYQYIVVPEEYRNEGGADVLQAAAEKFVKTHTSRYSNLIIAQVDKDNPVFDDQAKMRMLPYEIPGLRHFEMIPNDSLYAIQCEFPPASKQEPLTLRILSPETKGVLRGDSVIDMVKGLVSYYDVYPGHKIAGTKREAFDAYVNYHLKNVKFGKDGNVQLEYRGEKK